MLRINGVEKQLGVFKASFDLTIQTGERVVLIGESGSGKSTLLNLVAGFLDVDGGTMDWHKQRLNGLPPHRRPVTTLFQQHNLFAHLTVITNLALGISPTGRLSPDQKQQTIDLLQKVGLEGMEKRLPPSLSGGQQQRVALARCLLRPQPLLLLDEPFSALDNDTRQQVVKLTRQCLEGRDITLLMVSHDHQDASALEARIIRCRDGCLVD